MCCPLSSCLSGGAVFSSLPETSCWQSLGFLDCWGCNFKQEKLTFPAFREVPGNPRGVSESRKSWTLQCGTQAQCWGHEFTVECPGFPCFQRCAWDVWGMSSEAEKVGIPCLQKCAPTVSMTNVWKPGKLGRCSLSLRDPVLGRNLGHVGLGPSNQGVPAWDSRRVWVALGFCVAIKQHNLLPLFCHGFIAAQQKYGHLFALALCCHISLNCAFSNVS